MQKPNKTQESKIWKAENSQPLKHSSTRRQPSTPSKSMAHTISTSPWFTDMLFQVTQFLVPTGRLQCTISWSKFRMLFDHKAFMQHNQSSNPTKLTSEPYIQDAFFSEGKLPPKQCIHHQLLFRDIMRLINHLVDGQKGQNNLPLTEHRCQALNELGGDKY